MYGHVTEIITLGKSHENREMKAVKVSVRELNYSTSDVKMVHLWDVAKNTQAE